jgi:hypothetical protein
VLTAPSATQCPTYLEERSQLNSLPRGSAAFQQKLNALKSEKIYNALKEQCHENFDFRFFFMNQFPPSP